MAEKEPTPSVSGASYVTTLISTPGQNTPNDFDSDDEFEIISLPRRSSSAESLESISTSLQPFDTKYPYENGRRYHALHAGAYPLPNDDREQDRMDLSHHIWKLVLGGELISEVVKDGLLKKQGGVQRILDVGTGTGIWAVDFADDWADDGVEVIGNDLSPIQPRWVPPNCTFEVDDFECTWTYQTSEAFDLIHARNLAGSVSSWPSLISSIAAHLEPGGWVELQEYEAEIFSDGDTGLKNAPNTKEWMRLLKVGGQRLGRRYDVVHLLEDLLKYEGLVDIGRDVYEVPIGPWAEDEILDEVGTLQQSSMIDAVEPYTLALLTRVLKWSLADTKALIERVKWELRNSNLRLYCRFHFVYGRRSGCAAG